MASPSNDPIERSEDPASGGGDAPTRVDGGTDRRPAMVLRLLLAGLIAMAGLAVASPGGRGAAVPATGSCGPPIAETGDGVPDVIVLPPGHPPIRGVGPQGQPVVTLPPGHPPVDGRRRGLPLPLPVRPQQPVFAAPTTVDL